MIRLSKSCISQAEKDAVVQVLNEEYLGMGKDVKVFEEELQTLFGRRVVCVSTGTAALQLGLQSLGVGLGDEVLLQSLTYVACFQAVTANGAVPVACDVYPETMTIDLEDARRRITSRTKAIMAVHYAGGVGDLNALYAFANENNLRVVEDASHAFGTLYKGRTVGSFGDVVCFSFDGIKNITCGEGGCIVSADDQVIKIASDARLLSVEGDSAKRYAGTRSWTFEVERQGWRYHMSNINAAIGIQQLRRLPAFAERRQKIASQYQEELRGVGSLSCLDLDYTEVVPHIFVVTVGSPASRDSLVAFLSDRGIQTGLHYYPNHLLAYFSSSAKVSLPITESLSARLLTLPLHPDLSELEVRTVIESVKEFFYLAIA